MIGYEVKLKVKNVKGKHITFMWQGETMRSGTEFPILFVEAENELEVYDRVSELSENTLEVLNITVSEEGTKELQEMIDFASNIYRPLTILGILQMRGLSVGLN